MVRLWLARCLGANLGLLEMLNANLKFQRTIHLVFALGESTKLSGSGVFTCANGVLSLNGL